MVNIYITNKFLDGVRYLPVLFPHLGFLKNEKRLFSDLGYLAFKEPVFNLVKDIKEADFILLPHDFFYVLDKNKKYLDDHLALARENKKKLLIFDLSDFSEKEIDVPRDDSIVFRIAAYRHRKKANEVIMPAFVEDISNYKKIFWRKKSNKAIVGFCGWADFRSKKQEIKFLVKNLFLDIRKILTLNRHLEVFKSGIYFRRKAIGILGRCDKIVQSFIIRKSYSSHRLTIELPPGEARKQFIENILDSDFTLCVRGDANVSFRFYEALSLGRIPLFVDTDCVLPLEDIIDYKEFTLYVDYKNLDNICDIAANFYKQLSDEQFIKMQKSARSAFENYLNTTSFLKYILPVLANKERKNI